MKHTLVCFALALPAIVAQAQAQPPVAPVRTVTDTFYGVRVDDPYRYFENKQNPEVAKWMKAQSEHAYATLKRIPGREALLEKISRYDSAASERVAQITRVPGDLYFIERRGATDNQYKLSLRRGLKGADQLLVDPEAVEKKTGQPHAINWYMPSPDGARLAYGLSAQGSEAAVLHLLDTRSGKPLGRPITRAEFGGVDWSPDGTQLVVNRRRVARAGG